MNPKTLAICTTAPGSARRFVITDTEGNYWCGKDTQWTRDRRKAGLFADHLEAGRKFHELMLTEVPGQLTTFSIEIIVEVKSLEPVNAKELGEWLKKSVKMFLDARQGRGPVEGSMVMAFVDWANIQQRENLR